jgi:hypothetical protein
MCACLSESERVGLCLSCKQSRLVPSDRRYVFYQCQRSAVDRHYPKYPVLPVLLCTGYETKADSTESPG